MLIYVFNWDLFKVWFIQFSLYQRCSPSYIASSLFIEVPVSSQESEYMNARGILSLFLRLFRLDCGIVPTEGYLFLLLFIFLMCLLYGIPYSATVLLETIYLSVLCSDIYYNLERGLSSCDSIL